MFPSLGYRGNSYGALFEGKHALELANPRRYRLNGGVEKNIVYGVETVKAFAIDCSTDLEKVHKS